MIVTDSQRSASADLSETSDSENREDRGLLSSVHSRPPPSSIMAENWRVFKLLMQKNGIVRRKHWKLCLFVEVTIPLLLFLLGQTVRMLSGDGPTKIDHNTYYNIDHDVPAPHSGFQLRYAPTNELSDRIMERTRQCMDILATRNYNFYLKLNNEFC